MQHELTNKYLHECFDYDAETGLLIWKRRPRNHFPTEGAWKTVNTREAGKPAGHLEGRNKTIRGVVLTIGGAPRRYFMAQLVWMWHSKRLHDHSRIRYKDGNRMNSRIENLELIPLVESRRKPGFKPKVEPLKFKPPAGFSVWQQPWGVSP